MPRGDGTGPRWGGGGCWWGRGGRGVGFGRGFGAGRGYWAQPQQGTAENSAELKAYAERLALELESVRKRIAELGKE